MTNTTTTKKRLTVKDWHRSARDRADIVETFTGSPLYFLRPYWVRTAEDRKFSIEVSLHGSNTGWYGIPNNTMPLLPRNASCKTLSQQLGLLVGGKY